MNEQIESSQRQHHNEMQHQVQMENLYLQHQEKMQILELERQYKRFAMIKPTLVKEGNSWCVLFGENLQEGIAAFGDTPHEAIVNWEKEWDKP